MKIVIAFISIASFVVFISTVSLILETHYHFSMYQSQTTDMNVGSPAFDIHFEQALVQSVLWTALIAIAIAVFLSLYVARKLTAPLISMKKIAEQMAKGQLEARTLVNGHDEIAELGNSLNRLAVQLAHQEQLRMTMTADVAHELRTPLTTLKSHMEAMMDGVWEPTSDRLASCYEEIERLRNIVGDLEQLTEMESPHFELLLREDNLSAIVKQAIDVSSASFAQKGVRLSFDPSEAVFAFVDRQRIAQVLGNLLSNALKFTPQGGQVTVELKSTPDSAIIVVTDSGIGIAQERLPYIFERFYRVEQSRDRKSGGSGIGLAIVKKLIDAHHGCINVDSMEGSGTSITIILPR